jgi:hypothetical protein
VAVTRRPGRHGRHRGRRRRPLDRRHSTPTAQTLIEAIAAHKPGDVIKVKVQHQDGTTATFSVTLGQLPS